MTSTIALYPWYCLARNLLFWQAVWFLIFQERLSAAEAILLYAVFDVATTALEVPSGYMSDRIGRRVTLILAAAVTLVGSALLLVGDTFWALALAQALLGAGMAFASGTDTSLLYEALAADGRAEEVERHEVRAWRYGFAGLTVSALTGGVMATWSDALPFAATTLAAAATLALAWRFREPPHKLGEALARGRFGALKAALATPVLIWLFALSVAMYVFSHVPFVFGQPFIVEALAEFGWQDDAPMVSGAVSAAMMAVSLGTSWLAPGLRRALGLGGLLLLAFALQIGLSGVLALTNETLAIAILFLRMVPDSFARPYILARAQRALPGATRATYLSLQSFTGRLIFAGTLIGVSGQASAEAGLAYADLRVILAGYVAAGLVTFAGLAIGLRWAPLDAPRPG